MADTASHRARSRRNETGRLPSRPATRRTLPEGIMRRDAVANSPPERSAVASAAAVKRPRPAGVVCQCPPERWSGGRGLPPAPPEGSGRYATAKTPWFLAFAVPGPSLSRDRSRRNAPSPKGQRQVRRQPHLEYADASIRLPKRAPHRPRYPRTRGTAEARETPGVSVKETPDLDSGASRERHRRPVHRRRVKCIDSITFPPLEGCRVPRNRHWPGPANASTPKGRPRHHVGPARGRRWHRCPFRTTGRGRCPIHPPRPPTRPSSAAPRRPQATDPGRRWRASRAPPTPQAPSGASAPDSEEPSSGAPSGPERDIGGQASSRRYGYRPTRKPAEPRGLVGMRFARTPEGRSKACSGQTRESLRGTPRSAPEGGPSRASSSPRWDRRERASPQPPRRPLEAEPRHDLLAKRSVTRRSPQKESPDGDALGRASGRSAVLRRVPKDRSEQHLQRGPKAASRCASRTRER